MPDVAVPQEVAIRRLIALSREIDKWFETFQLGLGECQMDGLPR